MSEKKKMLPSQKIKDRKYKNLRRVCIRGMIPFVFYIIPSIKKGRRFPVNKST
jgi:hypothetical protein